MSSKNLIIIIIAIIALLALIIFYAGKNQNDGAQLNTASVVPLNEQKGAPTTPPVSPTTPKTTTPSPEDVKEAQSALNDLSSIDTEVQGTAPKDPDFTQVDTEFAKP